MVEPSAPRGSARTQQRCGIIRISPSNTDDTGQDCEHTCRSFRVRAAQRHADSTERVLIQLSLSRLSANDHLCGECWRDRCSATPHRLPKEVLTLPERFRDCVKLKYHRRQDFPICGKISSFKNSSCATLRQLYPTTAALTDGNGSSYKTSKSTHLQND